MSPLNSLWESVANVNTFVKQIVISNNKLYAVDLLKERSTLTGMKHVRKVMLIFLKSFLSLPINSVSERTCVLPDPPTLS